MIISIVTGIRGYRDIEYYINSLIFRYCFDVIIVIRYISGFL